MNFSKKSLIISFFALFVSFSAFSMSFHNWINKIDIFEVQESSGSVKIRVNEDNTFNGDIEDITYYILERSGLVIRQAFDAFEDPYADKLNYDQMDAENYKIQLQAFQRFILDVKFLPQVCLLGECRCPELRREHHPWDRVEFENAFAKKTLFSDVWYAGFGPGALFPDARILLTYIKEGKVIQEIHLTDTAYKDAIQLLLTVKDVNKKTSLFNFLFSQGFECTKKYITAAIKIIRFVQFVDVISAAAKRTIDVYLHDSVPSYLKTKKDTAPNVVTAMDYAFVRQLHPTKRYHLRDDISDFYNFLTFGVYKGAIVGTLYTKGSEIGGCHEAIQRLEALIKK